MIGFGIAGYLMRKADLDPAPLVLAFVLGNILETTFARPCWWARVPWRRSTRVRSRPR